MSAPDVTGASLTPYDPDTACPKCGWADVATVYFEAKSGCADRNCISCDRHPEFLLRRCERCRYGWKQAVADTPAVLERSLLLEWLRTASVLLGKQTFDMDCQDLATAIREALTPAGKAPEASHE